MACSPALFRTRGDPSRPLPRVPAMVWLLPLPVGQPVSCIRQPIARAGHGLRQASCSVLPGVGGGGGPGAAPPRSGPAGRQVLDAGTMSPAPGGQVSSRPRREERNSDLRSFPLVPPGDELICAAANLCRMLRHGQLKRLLLAEIFREERYLPSDTPIGRWRTIARYGKVTYKLPVARCFASTYYGGRIRRRSPDRRPRRGGPWA